MPRFLTRFTGLLLLTIALTVPSCQTVFQVGDALNAPQQLSPGSFQR
jgi:hypothetical protein